MLTLMKRLFLIIAFLLVAIQVQAACVTAPTPCVQAAHATNAGAGSTLSIAFPGSQATGNLNYVTFIACGNSSCSGDPGMATCSVTDSHSQTYTVIQTNSVSVGFVICTLYAPNIVSGANTLHFSVVVATGDPYYLQGQISEWSGLTTSTPLDVSAKNSGTGTSLTVTSASTNHANEIVIGSGIALAGGLATGAGYTPIDSGYLNDEFKAVSSTGAQTATFTGASGAWAINVATFQCVTTCTGGGGGLTPAQKARGFFNILP